MDLQPIVQALRHSLRDQGHKNVELEFRFGRVINGAFVAGVSKATFEKLFAILDTSPAFQRHEITSLERLNGTDARYVIMNGDESTGEWCYKKKVAVITESGGSDLVCRTAVALEGRDHAPPPAGSPPFVYHRMKKRTSFVHQYWSVDMTRVTSNLPNQFDNDEEIYEVEIELANGDAYFVYTLPYLVEWGLHFIHELQSLLHVTA